MKVLQVIQQPQLRGAEIFACQLSTQLEHYGVESVIVSLFDGNAVLPFSGKIVKLNRSAKFRFLDFQGWKALACVIRDEEPQIVQANAADTLKYCVFSKLLFKWKAPIIFRNASTVSLYIKNSFTRGWNSFLYRHTNFIVSVSEASRRDLIRLFPPIAHKCQVIPVAIDLKDSADSKIDLPGNPSLLHVGGFTFEKNHAGLIMLFQRLLMACPDAHLCLVGDGPLRGETQLLVAKSGLQNRVTFYGYQKEPGQFMRAADLLVLPSIIEGLPSVILEAGYYKLPVVAYNVGGIPEVVSHEETGWLVGKDDSEAFIDSIKQILSNSNRRTAIVENAYNLVRQKYNLKAITRSFRDLYQQVVKTQRH